MTSTPDGPPELGTAFELPEYLAADPALVAMYHKAIRDLMAEARGLPMHTVQEFLLERIATKYVIMKFRERNNNWLGINTEKDFNAQWLDLVKEWNRVLAAGQDKLRDAVLKEAEGISLGSLQLIEDDELRKKLRIYYKEKYAAIGF